MKIVATKIKAIQLNPGDLFSTAGQEYWDSITKDKLCVGEKVYIRTVNPCPENQANEDIFRLSIFHY